MLHAVSTKESRRLTPKMTNQFPYDEASTDSDPVLFWKKLSRTAEGKLLANIALPLLQFPQSSASVERSFSAVRRVHTWQGHH